ncbi:unnamed protein product [Blepharisma stoltei]|uniref:Uncharacterized protein n=1 Tax=Blepharisma stoltei TaxID=1481888 RepID=A0AAU9IRE2_9CILI|nr:unnamed protein product [Blepharisma stoltei]
MEEDKFIATLALKKSAIHCARHPGRDVYGALVGDSKVNDAIPLFHTRPTTAATEVALLMLSQFNIIGFYESRIRGANEELEPSRYITQLCQALKNKGAASVFVLCIESDWNESNIMALFRLDNKGTNFTKQTFDASFNKMSLTDFLIGHENIVDIDDHLANPRLDWRNQNIQ